MKYWSLGYSVLLSSTLLELGGCWKQKSSKSSTRDEDGEEKEMYKKWNGLNEEATW